MLKTFATLAVAVLLAGTAFAQQTRDTAQDLMTQAGIEIEIPETATDDQINQILAVVSSDAKAEDKEAQIKQILGM